MKQITFESNFTPADLQAAYMSHVKFMSWKRIVIMATIAFLLIACGVFLLIQRHYESGNRWLSVFFIAYGFFFLALYYWRLQRMGKTAFRRLVDLHFPFYTTISETEINTKSNSIESTTKWEHYSMALINDKVILLYPNKLKFIIISRRFLSSEDFSAIAKLAILKIAKTRDKRKDSKQQN